jgi:biopolymer transport protein ExbD
MLVLLVIFIVTAPLLTNSVPLELPRTNAAATETRPDTIEFSIDASGNLYWDGASVSRDEAQERFAEAARGDPQPALHLRADSAVPYRFVAETLADASRAGLARIGFISAKE